MAFQTKGQEQDGSILEKRVTIIQKTESLKTILDQISWQAGVFFSYDATVIDAEKEFSLDATNKSLYTILNLLFDSSNFEFTELDNQIIISKKIHDNNIYDIERTDSIPVKYFFLSGKITDNRKGDPISYATISIFNKPIGTISNSEGEFLLKIHPNNIRDSIIISCMGYAQIIVPALEILDDGLVQMKPISIRIREVKVTSVLPEEILKKIRENLGVNYSENIKLMTAFYRETVKQDGEFISVSEAVVEMLKAPYHNSARNDIVKIKKGRRSPDVKPFQWFNFKLQGGPFTITKLDVVKTIENFIDEKYENLYNYNISKVIWYNNNPVYVVAFKPVSNFLIQSFEGELYVHRETFAIVHVNFHLNRNGLKNAESIMIKRKPKGVKAKPTYVYYQVNYQQFGGKWQLANAQASVKFKVRSKRDKLNSEYHSVSDLLITDIKNTDLKKFGRNESFTQHDVFVEMINEYDQKFWENYNIIKPDEDLRNAFKKGMEN